MTTSDCIISIGAALTGVFTAPHVGWSPSWPLAIMLLASAICVVATIRTKEDS